MGGEGRVVAGREAGAVAGDVVGDGGKAGGASQSQLHERPEEDGLVAGPVGASDGAEEGEASTISLPRLLSFFSSIFCHRWPNPFTGMNQTKQRIICYIRNHSVISFPYHLRCHSLKQTPPECNLSWQR